MYFFKQEIGRTSQNYQKIGGSPGKVGDLAALHICLCMHMYMCAGVFLSMCGCAPFKACKMPCKCTNQVQANYKPYPRPTTLLLDEC